MVLMQSPTFFGRGKFASSCVCIKARTPKFGRSVLYFLFGLTAVDNWLSSSLPTFCFAGCAF